MPTIPSRAVAALALAAAASLSVLSTTPARAQTVTYNGNMGEKALLVIDGQPKVVAQGQVLAGVRLDSVGPEGAHVQVNGKPMLLKPGLPVTVGHTGAAGGSGQEIVLTASGGGHFLANGSVNGKPMRFMVDTGATTVSFDTGEATRLGVDWRKGRPVMMGTANGTTMGWQVELTSVRIGDVEVYGVPATITQQPMPYALLGNSFLGRFDMQRSNDTMRLTRKF